MKYKICLLLLIVVLFLGGFTFLLSSCDFRKEVKRETENVVGVVVDTNFTPSRIIPMHCGKITTFIRQPAHYSVYVEYNGVREIFNDSFLYDNYKAGDNIDLILITIYYDNGNIERILERSD